MSSVRRRRGAIEVGLDRTERRLLFDLATQFLGVIEGDDSDPALVRLFPDGYRNDPEAAAEFRTYTREGLVTHKKRNAERVVARLADIPLELDDDDAESWLPFLTDLRLVVAERLGIVADGDDPNALDTSGGGLAAAYDWLGELQWQLVEALDGRNR